MTPLFSLDYWFNTRPELLSRSAVLALVLVGLVCAYLIYLAKNKQKNKDYSKGLWYRLENFAISNLALSWIMALCYHQGIPFFSAKFWLPLWLLANALYLFFLLKKFKKLPNRLEQIQQEKDFKKYIPKKAQ